MINLQNFDNTQSMIKDLVGAISCMSLSTKDKFKYLEKALNTAKDITVSTDYRNYMRITVSNFEFTVYLENNNLVLNHIVLIQLTPDYSIKDEELRDNLFDEEIKTMGGYAVYNWKTKSIYVCSLLTYRNTHN